MQQYLKHFQLYLYSVFTGLSLSIDVTTNHRNALHFRIVRAYACQRARREKHFYFVIPCAVRLGYSEN